MIRFHVIGSNRSEIWTLDCIVDTKDEAIEKFYSAHPAAELVVLREDLTILDMAKGCPVCGENPPDNWLESQCAFSDGHKEHFPPMRVY